MQVMSFQSREHLAHKVLLTPKESVSWFLFLHVLFNATVKCRTTQTYINQNIHCTPKSLENGSTYVHRHRHLLHIQPVDLWQPQCVSLQISVTSNMCHKSCGPWGWICNLKCELIIPFGNGQCRNDRVWNPSFWGVEMKAGLKTVPINFRGAWGFPDLPLWANNRFLKAMNALPWESPDLWHLCSGWGAEWMIHEVLATASEGDRWRSSAGPGTLPTPWLPWRTLGALGHTESQPPTPQKANSP